MKKLKDSDPMPMGDTFVVGKPMSEIHPRFLMKLWMDGLKDETETEPVAEYIQRNLTKLRQRLLKREKGK